MGFSTAEVDEVFVLAFLEDGFAEVDAVDVLPFLASGCADNVAAGPDVEDDEDEGTDDDALVVLDSLTVSFADAMAIKDDEDDGIDDAADVVIDVLAGCFADNLETADAAVVVLDIFAGGILDDVVDVEEDADIDWTFEDAVVVLAFLAGGTEGVEDVDDEDDGGKVADAAVLDFLRKKIKGDKDYNE